MSTERKPQRTRGVVATLVVAAVIAAVFLWRAAPDRDVKSPVADSAAGEAVAATYVGSTKCAACHAQQAQGWRESQHARAMQPATEATVLGDFADATFNYAGVESRFYRRDGRFYVLTDGPDGQPAEYEVRFTFGVEPLQQYLVELPGGRLQALSIAWDSRPQGQGNHGWFHLYPDERIDYRDELHWTRRPQNWNFMCADCHSTAVEKRYDAEGDAYATNYAEISVGCEACHGPGSAHVAWAAVKNDDPTLGLSVRFDERRGITWPRDAAGVPRRSAPRTTATEIDACAPCHARRSQVAEGWRAGAAFLDHYLPALPVPPLYHPDGQQRDEVFVWGSWLQSRMHAAGVTCSDCHDPHTQKPRLQGNLLCAQCHDAARYDTRAHHRHPEQSRGALCVECHMARETYMVLDPRRDHSMRVPRPDRTVALGMPNACNSCHRESDAAWAAARVRVWLGRDARGSDDFAEAFDGATRGDVRTAPALRTLAGDAARPPIVRAAALSQLATAGRADRESVATAARDGEALVRLAAATAGESLAPADRIVLTPLLRDARRAVRIEAARTLAPYANQLPPEARSQWQVAADEYVATLRYTADRPEARVALGTFHASLGRLEEALASFESARRLDPVHEPAWVNAADVLRAAGRDAEAVALLRQGLGQVPEAASLHHALGLALVRTQEPAAALEHLRLATERAPDVARFAYVHAIALDSSGRRDEALRALTDAAGRWPFDRDILFALAALQAQSGRTDAARATAAQLRERFPDDPEASAFADRLR